MNTLDMSETIWHVIHTKPQMEFTAAFGLTRQLQYRTFAPFCFVQTRHARKVTDVRRPVFVRYVLVGRSPRRSIYDVQHHPGVAGIVMFKDEPAVVPSRIVAALMEKCEADGWMRSDDDSEELPQFKPKQEVKIHTGPLEGFIGQVKSLDRDGRLCVTVEMFGAARSISVPNAVVKVVETEAVAG